MMSDTCSTIRLKGLSEAPREKLLEVIAELLSQIASLEKKDAGQQKSIKKLRDELEKTREQLKKIQEQLEEAQRSAHRQAAPFRVDEKKRKEHARRPGRKEGHRGSYRPRSEAVDESMAKSAIPVAIVNPNRCETSPGLSANAPKPMQSMLKSSLSSP